jgi:ferritin
MELIESLYSRFQAQYNQELINSAVYESIANQADALAWNGCAAYLLKAGKEELEHAEGFRGFLEDRNRTPKITVHPAQTIEGIRPLDWLTLSYEAEQQNTKRLSDLYWTCFAEKDADAMGFLTPYLEEQRLSERELWDFIQMLRRSGSNAADLQIDEMLGEKAGG